MIVTLLEPVWPLTTRISSVFLYLVTRCTSQEDCDIKLAYVSISRQRARDDLHLIDQGKKLTPERQEELREKLILVRPSYFESKGLEGWKSPGGTVTRR